MTLRLILTRHAKSDWDDPLMADEDRPLNSRGRASADALGRWMKTEGLTPDPALVSAATRTQETWGRIAGAAGWDIAPNIRPDLYLASPDRMLSVLTRATGACVKMVAHNPGSADMAANLLRDRPSESGFDAYPTGATAVIDFDADDWGQVTWRSGRLIHFTLPRSLLANEKEAAN